MAGTPSPPSAAASSPRGARATSVGEPPDPLREGLGAPPPSSPSARLPREDGVARLPRAEGEAEGVLVALAEPLADAVGAAEGVPLLLPHPTGVRVRVGGALLQGEAVRGAVGEGWREGGADTEGLPLPLPEPLSLPLGVPVPVARGDAVASSGLPVAGGEALRVGAAEAEALRKAEAGAEAEGAPVAEPEHEGVPLGRALPVTPSSGALRVAAPLGVPPLAAVPLPVGVPSLLRGGLREGAGEPEGEGEGAGD